MAKKKAAASAAAAPSSAPSSSESRSVIKRSPPSASSFSHSSSVGLEYWLAYLFLVHLRLLLCLAGTGYIHPDEYFQSSEPLLGDLLDLPTLRTWEFTVENPCRSMASVRFWNWPLVIVALLYRRVGAIPTARTLWLVQRVTALVLSLVVDFCWTYLVPRTRTRAGEKDGQRIMQARLLYASSGATLAFLIRPFSNSVETALLAVSLAVLITLRRHAQGARGRQWHLLSAALGGLFALGLFARFTFAIFALPAGLAFLHTCWTRASADRRILGLLKLSSGAVLGFLGTAAAHIAYDSFYYRSRLAAIDGTLSAPSGLVVVPWNALQYNLSTDNLSEHGIHPRWLHVVVNAPMILGVPIWISCLLLLYKRMKTFGSPSPPAATSSIKSPSQESSIELLHLASVFLPLALLSIQPHQEARFLLPLLVPSIALLPLIPPKRLVLFSSVHILQAAGLALFFGVLHQAGVVPALLRINEEVLHFSGAVPLNKATLQALALQGEGGAEGLWLGDLLNTPGSAAGVGVGVGGVTLVVHVWRSFMPPRHLLLPAGAGAGASGLPRVTLIDHGSQTPQDLLANLSGTASKQEQEQEHHLLLAPTWALDSLLPLLSADDSAATATGGHSPLQLDTLALLSPHVDTDHLSESWSLLRNHKHQPKHGQMQSSSSSSSDPPQAAAAAADASRLALLIPEWANNLLAPIRTRWKAVSEGLGESFALGVVHVRMSGLEQERGDEREVAL